MHNNFILVYVFCMLCVFIAFRARPSDTRPFHPFRPKTPEIVCTSLYVQSKSDAVPARGAPD